MTYSTTFHARYVLEIRQIQVEWMERALFHPVLTESCEDDPTLERRYAVIPEYGNRVLRVVVNKESLPECVVSVYFDRSKRGKL
jgi:hypothetical protein